MSIENTFERIAVALETLVSIANSANAPKNQAPADTVAAPAAPAPTMAPPPAKKARNASKPGAGPVATPPAAQVSSPPSNEGGGAASGEAAPVAIKFDTVADAVMDIANNVGRDAAIELMKKFGVSRAGQLKPEQFAKVLAEAAKAKAEHESKQAATQAAPATNSLI